MIEKYNFYSKESLSFNKDKQNNTPFISFPTKENLSQFHEEDLCVAILELLKQYISLRKGQAVAKKMTPEQKKIYFQLQEKMIFLDSHDIEQILKNPLLKELHEVDESQEVESFIYLMDEAYHPDEIYSYEQEQERIGVFHK